MKRGEGKAYAPRGRGPLGGFGLTNPRGNGLTAVPISRTVSKGYSPSSGLNKVKRRRDERLGEEGP